MVHITSQFEFLIQLPSMLDQEDPVASQYALIDVENLILDVASLSLALCRFESRTKVPESCRAEFDGRGVRDATSFVLNSTLSRSNSSKSIDSLSKNIDKQIRHQSDLVRPFFGAPSFLQYIASQLHLQSVFVTANPHLIISALNPSLHSTLSLMHFTDADLSTSVDVPIGSLVPPISDLTFCPADVGSPLYFVGRDIILRRLPPLSILLSRHVLFFKSSHVLDTLVKSSSNTIAMPRKSAA